MICLRFLCLAVFACAIVALSCPVIVWAGSDVTVRARKFVAAHEARLRRLEVAASLAWWNANISGKDEDFKKKEEAQNRVDEALANPTAFQEVKALKEHGKE